MNIRRSVPLVAAVMALLLVAGQVFAAISYSYSLIIPPFGLSISTNNQAKSGNCTNVSLTVSQIRSGFVVNAGAQTSAGRDISQFQRVTAGSRINYPEINTVGQCGAGQLRRIQFSTDVTTLINVSVSGNWSPG